MPTVLGELRFGHTTSVWMFLREVFGVCVFGKCPAVVPCATEDGESGSKLNWISNFVLQEFYKINPACVKI